MVKAEASATVGVPQRAAMIDVAITFCNGVVFLHNHTVVRDAVTDYAERLIDAIEPPEAKLIGSPLLDQREWPAPHVRQVAMVFYDGQGEHMKMIDSGIFPCEHHG
jgi:hypothetical protein